MYHFFIQAYQVQRDGIKIEGADVNHIKNVLRMKPSEEVTVTDEDRVEYHCRIQRLEEDAVWLDVLGKTGENHELPAKITLFLGILKGEKMEWILQKAVELGVYEIVPMETKRCVVKLDEKKKEAKQKRWNAIAQSAAKQSKRSLIPNVHSILSYQESLSLAKELDLACIPYEQAKGMGTLKNFLGKLQPGMTAGFLIGPEGGFEEEEVQLALEKGIEAVSLGKRVLRAETAGMALLSMIMLQLEMENE